MHFFFESGFGKKGFYGSPWRIIPTKISPNDRSIKFHFVQQPSELLNYMGYNYPLAFRRSKESEKFRPISACANCSGWHGSMLFANALISPFLQSIAYVISNLTILISENYCQEKSLLFYMTEDSFENIIRKGENADNQYFLLNSFLDVHRLRRRVRDKINVTFLNLFIHLFIYSYIYLSINSFIHTFIHFVHNWVELEGVKNFEVE